MKYARELLQTALVNEASAYVDAVNFLNGGQPSFPTSTEKSTWKAFVESKRLSEERIPQLQAAIDVLDASWDYFTNAPKEKDSGERPAFKTNGHLAITLDP